MSDLYRKSSLEKLSSPEQLDKMIEITSPMFWIGAAGGGIVLIAALLWSVFARLPINVQSNGIFISKGGIQTIYAQNPGTVKEILVSKGETVSKNTVLARFDTQSIQSKIDKLEERRAALIKVTPESGGEPATADNKDLLDIRAQFLTVSANLTSDELMLDMMRRQLKDQQAKTNASLAGMKVARNMYYAAMNAGSTTGEQLHLAKQPFLSRLNENYNVSLQDYNTELSRLRSLEDTVSQLQVQVSAEEMNLSGRYDTLRTKFEGTKAAVLESLDSQLGDARKELENSEIRSGIPGYVVAMDIVIGSAVQSGSPVCTLSQTERLFELSAGDAKADGEEIPELNGSVKSENVVICYVPLPEGKKIGKGMEAMVYPSTINRQETGHIDGTVIEVADYVTSMEDVKNRLGDSSLVQAFTGSGPVVMVTVELEEDPATASGYKWSGKKGAEVTLAPGTMVSVDVVTEEKAPITMLLPLLKEKLTVHRENSKK